MFSPVDAIHTLSTISTRVAVALIDVDLTVLATSARLASTLIPIDQIFAVTPILTRVALALVYLGLTQVPCEARVTVAREGVLSINTLPSMTWGALAVINVGLAVHSCVSCRTPACVACYGVQTDAPVVTRVAFTVIDVDLTTITSETIATGALKCVNHVMADSSIETGVELALIYVYLALRTRETCKKATKLQLIVLMFLLYIFKMMFFLNTALSK